jgi:hypothetical protein
MEEEKKKKKNVIGDPNEWHIEITPRRAGNFGSCSISSIKYRPREAEELAIEMKEQIKRHVDNVSYISDIVYESFICTECDSNYETRESAENCDCE